MREFFRVAGIVVRKDLTVEVRSLEVLSTTIFFAVTVVLIFAFGFVKDGAAARRRGRRHPVDRAVVLGHPGPGPDVRAGAAGRYAAGAAAGAGDRPAIYAGKLAGILLLLAIVEAVLVPLVGLFFQAPILASAGWLAALLVAGTLGFAAVGTLFAAMLVRARSRDVLLPVLLYPMTVPVMIAGVRGTAALFQPQPDLGLVQFWLALLVFFDVVFVTLALWTFEPVMTD